jgi:hypothetical protein
MFEANTSRAVNNINQLGSLLQNISTQTKINVNSGALYEAS